MVLKAIDVRLMNSLICIWKLCIFGIEAPFFGLQAIDALSIIESDIMEPCLIILIGLFGSKFGSCTVFCLGKLRFLP